MQSKTSWSSGHDGSVRPEYGRDRLAAGAAADAPRPQRTGCPWFNAALFQKNLTRFWPVWALYGIIWMFMMPVNLLSNMRYGGMETVTRFAVADVLDWAQATMVTALIFGVLAAMCVFSYLYNSRSVSLYHTLPLRREGLFATSYLSGLVFLAGPAAVVFGLTLLAEAVAGYVDAGALCMWLVIHLLNILFFYSFAVFCAMFTGNILALPAFYGILNGLAAAIYAIADLLLGQFLYGYQQVQWASELALWLTPSAKIASEIRINQNISGPYETLGQGIAQGTVQYSFQGLHIALLYGFVGLVLAGVALALYRRRQLESAGDVVSVAWVRPVFKYGVGACGAMVGGSWLYWLFSYNATVNPLGLLAWMLPCGAVGYFVAEMLLQKRFRVFRRWRGCVVLLAAVALGVGGVWLDPLGFSQWTPDPARVAQVSTYLHTYPGDHASSDLMLTSQEEIAQFVAAHRGITAQRDQWRAGLWTGVTTTQGRGALPGGGGYDYRTMETSNMRIEYQMKNGDTVWRSYEFLVSEDQLADPDSYAAILQALMNDSDRRMAMYDFPTEPDVRLVAADLQIYNRAEDSFYGTVLPPEGLDRLYAAIQSDLAAGRLGVRYLMEGQERMENCYYNDLTLGFYSPDTRDANAAKEYGETRAPRAATTMAASMEESNWNIRITLQPSATETLAVLEELVGPQGVEGLITWAQYRHLEEMRSGS